MLFKILHNLCIARRNHLLPIKYYRQPVGLTLVLSVWFSPTWKLHRQYGQSKTTNDWQPACTCNYLGVDGSLDYSKQIQNRSKARRLHNFLLDELSVVGFHGYHSYQHTVDLQLVLRSFYLYYDVHLHKRRIIRIPNSDTHELNLGQ